MKQLSILTIQFYRLLVLYNIAFTIVALVLILFGGVKISIASFFIAKLMGFIFAVGLHYFNSKNEYFYFRNAGYSIRWIILSTLAADILVYWVIASLSILISYA